MMTSNFITRLATAEWSTFVDFYTPWMRQNCKQLESVQNFSAITDFLLANHGDNREKLKGHGVWQKGVRTIPKYSKIDRERDSGIQLEIRGVSGAAKDAGEGFVELGDAIQYPECVNIRLNHWHLNILLNLNF